jgi:hypothetical protein
MTKWSNARGAAGVWLTRIGCCLQVIERVAAQGGKAFWACVRAQEVTRQKQAARRAWVVWAAGAGVLVAAVGALLVKRKH